MDISDEQVIAVEFIHANPGAKVSEITRAAGVSAIDNRDAEFIVTLIDSGLVQLVGTSDVRIVLDNDVDDTPMTEAAEALAAFYETHHHRPSAAGS